MPFCRKIYVRKLWTICGAKRPYTYVLRYGRFAVLHCIYKVKIIVGQYVDLASLLQSDSTDTDVSAYAVVTDPTMNYSDYG
jgi:hypothetical protein